VGSWLRLKVYVYTDRISSSFFRDVDIIRIDPGSVCFPEDPYIGDIAVETDIPERQPGIAIPAQVIAELDIFQPDMIGPFHQDAGIKIKIIS